MVTDVEFAAAVMVGVPAQVVAALGTAATLSWPPRPLVGRVSLIAVSVKGLADRLVKRICMRVTAPSEIGPAGVKLLLALSVLALMVAVVSLDAPPLQIVPEL